MFYTVPKHPYLRIESVSDVPIRRFLLQCYMCIVGSRSNTKHLTHQPRPELASEPEVRKSSRAPRPRQMDTDYVTDFTPDDEDEDEDVYYMEYT